MKGLINVEINWSEEVLEGAQEVASKHKVELSDLLKEVMSSYMSVFLDEHEDKNEEFTFTIKYEVTDDE